jgi:arsenite methyltransferase
MAERRLSDNEAKRIRQSVKDTYRSVADGSARTSPYPVGAASASELRYEVRWIESIPREVVERFVGIGNPFLIHWPAQGDRVLDVGSGCGFDSYVASLLVGERGRVVGLDLTPEMVDVARHASRSWRFDNVEFREGSVEELPFSDGDFDLVISNGVLNLVPDKDAAFRELARVLRPGGRFVVADVLVDETIPEDLLAQKDAWSG